MAIPIPVLLDLVDRGYDIGEATHVILGPQTHGLQTEQTEGFLMDLLKGNGWTCGSLNVLTQCAGFST